MLVERGAVNVDLSCLMHCTIHRYSKLPSSHKMRFLSRELSQDEFFVSRNEILLERQDSLIARQDIICLVRALKICKYHFLTSHETLIACCKTNMQPCINNSEAYTECKYGGLLGQCPGRIA